MRESTTDGRAFTLIECLAVVALIALAASVVAVGLAPGAAEARLRDARSVVLDVDARARALAQRGGGVVLCIDEGRVVAALDDEARPIIARELPDGVRATIVDPRSGRTLAGVRVDRCGESPDYVVTVRAGGIAS